MDGIVSLLHNPLMGWHFVETPYYEHGINSEEEFDYHDSDSPPVLVLANDQTDATPSINVRDDADYFIDGVMHIAIVGYVYQDDPNITFPIIAGDVVASCGELYNKSFRVINHKHTIVLTHPKELHITDKVYSNLKDCIVRWTNAEFKPLKYPCNESAGESNNCANLSTKSHFRQAKHEVLNYMRKEEKRLLDGIVNNPGNYRVFIDGEFQSSNIAYDSTRVISICKQLSLQSLESKFGLRAGEITNLGEGEVSKAYQWLSNDEYSKLWYTWFMRLRQHTLPDRDRTMSDIIQCTVVSDSSPDKSLIDGWTDRLRKLAYPTCYGLDKSRWRTHIYPIYLTELYGKQRQLSIEHFNKLIYG